MYFVVANIGKVRPICRSCRFATQADRPFVCLASGTVHVCCLDQENFPRWVCMSAIVSFGLRTRAK